MEGFLKKLVEKKIVLEEEDVWRIFDDLARACGACERGTEDVNAEAWEHEVAHLDLKPPNGK